MGAPRLDSFDREILEFILKWLPFDGPDPEDVFIRFGMPYPQLLDRAADIIADQVATPVRRCTDQLLIRQVAEELGIRPRTHAIQHCPSLPAKPVVEGELTREFDGLGLPPNNFWRNEKGVWRLR